MLPMKPAAPVTKTVLPSKDILYGKTFTDVTILDDEDNSILLEKTYNQNNSIYYSLRNSDLETASDNFKINTGKLLKAVQKNFINANTPKWRLKNPGGQPTMLDSETKQPISYEEYKKKITDGLFSEEEAIIMLSEMFDLINLNKDVKSNLSDFETAISKIGNSVAQKWNIPLDIFYGSKTEKSTGTNDFITFAVDPFFKLIEDGFNISLVGKESFLKGEYIAFNKLNITYKDIIESANGIDKLRGDGFSRNEINELLGLPKIDEPWADEHYITKNYGDVKGGAEGNG